MAAPMQGRICLVTGASSGIGKATALGLAKLGAKVLLVARDPTRGRSVLGDIERAAPGARADLLLADLESQAAVRALAEEVKRRAPRLHVLVNNAGAVFMKREMTVDGIERTFALDHLAYYLLTRLLLDLLRASAPARIVNVASAAHQNGRIRFDDLQGERRHAGMAAYAQAKLANVLFTYEMARRLHGTGVTANCLHPGVVSTGFGRNNPGWLATTLRFLAPFLLSPERGARTSIHLASSPGVEGVTGQYFVRCRAARSSRASYDEETARRLWDVSARLTGLPP